MTSSASSVDEQLMKQQQPHIQRVVLHALEHGCIPAHKKAGTQTGIIVSHAPAEVCTDSQTLQAFVERVESHTKDLIALNDETGRFSLKSVHAKEPYQDAPGEYSLHVLIDIHEKETSA